MGTPTLTLVVDTPVGCAGLHLCTTLDLPQLIVHTHDDFVNQALELTRDLRALGALRASLRRRLQASPLMDAARFVRNLARLGVATHLVRFSAP